MDETYLRNEVNALVDLLIKKNTDYGNSFDKLMEKYGGLAFIIRLSDKLGRLETIFESKQILVEDEGVIDTVDDIIGYCLLYKHFCMNKGHAGLNEMKEFYDDNYTLGEDKYPKVVYKVDKNAKLYPASYPIPKGDDKK